MPYALIIGGTAPRTYVSRTLKVTFIQGDTYQHHHFERLACYQPNLRPRARFGVRICKMSATKAQSQKIFEKLKIKPANRVRMPHPVSVAYLTDGARYASTAAKTTRHGRPYPLAYTSALIVRQTTETLACTSPSFGPPTSTVSSAQRLRQHSNIDRG
jgi:hypothetical protein